METNARFYQDHQELIATVAAGIAASDPGATIPAADLVDRAARIVAVIVGRGQRMEPDAPPVLITVPQAADVAGVSVQAIYQRIASGSLREYRRDGMRKGARLVALDDVRNWAKGRKE